MSGSVWVKVHPDFVAPITGNPPALLEYVVVGGGGGGGVHGGGGGGGYRSSVIGEASGGGESAEARLAVIDGHDYSIVVGEGGAASTGAGVPGENGGDSSVTCLSAAGETLQSIVSIGGGGGGTNSGNGVAGGSGGGGGSNANAGEVHQGGDGTPSQGFAGGRTGGLTGSPCGGGGGAGQLGGNSGGSPGNGGKGVTSSITGTPVARAGGGGGGSHNTGVGSNGEGGGPSSEGGGGRGTQFAVDPNGKQDGGDGVVIFRHDSIYDTADIISGNVTLIDDTVAQQTIYIFKEDAIIRWGA